MPKCALNGPRPRDPGASPWPAAHAGCPTAFYGEVVTTPLHAALGLPGTDLTLDLVEEACRQHVAESENLDFKRDLPLPSGDARAEETRARAHELAKDLAAMANSRGGMLIYGVRDEGDRAVELIGVPDLSDGVMEKRIRQVAYNFVYPPLEVRCLSLTDAERHALVVEIPESDEAPHLVQPRRDGGNEGWFIAPYRSGRDTNNMVEKQLEGAYRQRIDGRRQRQHQLRELHDELGVRHIGDADHGTGTVLVIAQPVRPRTGPLPEREPHRLAQHIVDSAAVLASQIAGEFRFIDQFPITLLHEARQPRRALRRFVFTASRQMQGEGGAALGRPAYVALELHDDGTFGLVWRRGAGYGFTRRVDTPPPTPAFGESDMDIIAILVTSLLVTIYEELKLTTDYQLKVALVPRSPIHVIPADGRADDDYPVVSPPPALEVDLRLGGGPDVRAAEFVSLGEDLCTLLERQHAAIEAFWELPNGTRSDHPRRQLAQRLFGGEPDHPVTGRPMA